MAAPGRTASGAASLFASTLCGLLLCLLLKCVVLAYGKQITCACTTQHCREQGTSRCNTTSMCYTQYLQSRDPNTDPITRGCINSRTPLLCENRRPAVHSAARWPQLVCCSANLCNEGVLPPPLHAETASSWPALRPEASSSGVIDGVPVSTELPQSPPNNEDDVGDDRLLSPVHVAVLSVGACALFAVALLVIVALVRRHAGLLGARYVRGNYIKGRRQSASDDGTPNGGTYDNKMAVVS
ncbi:hypothetical protein MTO96_015541 [Rhipicephalus appendiculatus]